MQRNHLKIFFLVKSNHFGGDNFGNSNLPLISPLLELAIKQTNPSHDAVDGRKIASDVKRSSDAKHTYTQRRR